MNVSNSYNCLLLTTLCLLCTISFVQCVSVANCECGIPNEGIVSRIVGGEVTAPHLYPWLVAIHHQGNMHCGGSLINNRYILTAGHCVKWVKSTDLTAYLGSHDRKTGDGILVEIAEAILHENFASDFLHDINDIALLKLKKPVRFNHDISPVCLPHPRSEYAGRTGLVAGWGREGAQEDPSRFLKQAEVKIMRVDQCKNTSIGSHISEGMMCAYAANTDACQGDSGGPLTYERKQAKFEQIGVVSWGIGCATPGIPGVYTKLTNYLDWIAHHTSDAVYCNVN